MDDDVRTNVPDTSILRRSSRITHVSKKYDSYVLTKLVICFRICPLTHSVISPENKEQSQFLIAQGFV